MNYFSLLLQLRVSIKQDYKKLVKKEKKIGRDGKR